MKSKKAAMEMSVGTIVTIVLLMSVLILGLFLVRNIFEGAGGAADMTIDQLNSQAMSLFGEDSSKVVIITPTSGQLTLKPGKSDTFGISIKNKAGSLDDSTSFTYTTTMQSNDCGLTKAQAESFIANGGNSSLSVPISGVSSSKIQFKIPSEGIPDCSIFYQIEVKKGSVLYKTEIIQLDINA